MQLSARDFFLGLVAGVVLTLVAVGALVGGLMYFSLKMSEEFMKDGAFLPALKFPDTSRLPAYGQADWNFSFRTLEGEPVRLGDFQGRVLVVNFWATWCGPCVAEMPSLENLRAKLEDDPVEFILLSDEEPSTVRKFIEEKKLNLPVHLYSGATPDVFEARAIPATFIVGADGIVVYKHIGAGRWDDDACVEFIRGLLPAPAVAPER